MIIRDIVEAMKKKTLPEINTAIEAIDDLKDVLPEALFSELYLGSVRGILEVEVLRKVIAAKKKGATDGV